MELDKYELEFIKADVSIAPMLCKLKNDYKIKCFVYKWRQND